MLSLINRASVRHVHSPTLSLSILILGDSIANASATTYAPDYVNPFNSYGIDATIYDAAQGGLNLGHFQEGATEDYYTARVLNDNAANLSTINTVLIGVGTNDGGNYGSKSAWKTQLQSLINNLKSDLSSLTHIFIRPLGHYTAHYNYEIPWQDMREAQIEVCNENADVYLLPSYVDLPLADNVHPKGASFQIMAQREAHHIAYVLDKDNTPYEDSILKINNLDFYTHAHYGKTIVSGNTFSNIGALNGNVMTVLNDNWTYDDTAFDGFGGMIPTSVNAGLHCGDIMTMTDSFMFGFTVEIGADGDLLLLGSTGYGAYGGASLFVENGHLKSYKYDLPNPLTGSGDLDTNLPTLASNIIGQRLSIIVDCQSQSEMLVYINNDTPIPLDPEANFFGWATLFLNGGRGYGSTLNKFGCIWGKSGAHDSVNDPSIAELMNKMKSDYNIL